LPTHSVSKRVIPDRLTQTKRNRTAGTRPVSSFGALLGF
jgi:hypothetical protein